MEKFPEYSTQPSRPRLSASCGRAAQSHVFTDPTLVRIIERAVTEARDGGCDHGGQIRKAVSAVRQVRPDIPAPEALTLVQQVRDTLPLQGRPEKMRLVMPLKLLVIALMLAFGLQAIPAARASNCDVSDKIDSSSAATARANMEKAGFRQVHDLEKGCDSFWHGKAEKDGVTVNVVLSPQGNVMVEGN